MSVAVTALYAAIFGLTIVVLSNRSEYNPVAVSDKVTDIYLD